MWIDRDVFYSLNISLMSSSIIMHDNRPIEYPYCFKTPMHK